ncbi:MAG: 2-phosphoglycerate kinase [Actinomycetota bacterium]|nr:2-phosphoglycerate kinase [Actinomycetota bacterium]MDI6821887.1 2-phosphoglycerate kinase [Actinomycetota bacterium]
MVKGFEFYNKRIVISDDKHGLPYSKGLMASSIMATGVPPRKAYFVAKLIEDHLRENRCFSVSIDELRSITAHLLRERIGEEYAGKYLKWQSLGKLDKPLIILIGGTTGVGKSTIATEIAHRLGITRIVSTDAIREVMRVVLSKELMPALYESSFSAWQSLRVPLPSASDPVIIGFREQTVAVTVGVKAIIERAIREGLNMVIEGIHIAPGFLDAEYFKNAFVVHIIIAVEDEDLHRSHFYIREIETEGFRPFERYRANFGNIRKIGEYIEELAKQHNTPIISSRNLDSTVSEVLEVIINKVIVPERFKEKVAE